MFADDIPNGIPKGQNRSILSIFDDFRIQFEAFVFEELRTALTAYYPQIKWLHVVSAAVWSFSTAVAYSWYLKPVLRASYRHPENTGLRACRDDWMDRFDRGAQMEHYALIVLVVTSLLMLWIGQIDLARWSFFTAMFWIGIVVILPMELIDIWLAHLGGNKAKVRASGDTERHERVMDLHWRFLRISEPIVVVLIPTMFYLGIVKPF